MTATLLYCCVPILMMAFMPTGACLAFVAATALACVSEPVGDA